MVPRNSEHSPRLPSESRMGFETARKLNRACRPVSGCQSHAVPSHANLHRITCMGLASWRFWRAIYKEGVSGMGSNFQYKRAQKVRLRVVIRAAETSRAERVPGETMNLVRSSVARRSLPEKCRIAQRGHYEGLSIDRLH